MFSNLPTPNRPVGKHTENAIFRALRDYFRIGGYSTGTENSRTERLDEYVGDCVNSRAFPATTGQVNECIALGGGRLLGDRRDRDWLTFNSAVLQFSEAFDKLRWMNRFCQ